MDDCSNRTPYSAANHDDMRVWLLVLYSDFITEVWLTYYAGADWLGYNAVMSDVTVMV